MNEGYVVLRDSHRPIERGAERVEDVAADAPVEVTVTLRGHGLSDLDTTERVISRSDFEERYGASPDDIEKVKTALERLGLVVEEVSRVGRSMRVSGTVAEMEKAFHPGLGIYSGPGQSRFRGREGDLQIPAELEGLVTGVFGFDERRMAARRSGSVDASAPAAAVAGNPLSPADLERHYNFPPGDGEGRQIAIAELGGTYFPDDLKLFCEKYQLAEPQVAVVDAGWKPPTPEQLGQLPQREQEEVVGDAGEVMMDIQIVAGLCPAAKIFVYFAKFTQKGWIDLINKVIQGDPASVDLLSISWGLAEDSPGWSKSALKEINLRLQAAAKLGITVCAASGDDGSGDMGEDDSCHVNFPASSPYVLSIGGTMLKDQKEEAWWESPGQRFLPGGEPSGGGSTGGGISAIFPRPAWQTVQVERPTIDGRVEPGIDGRVIPDIAALAGPPLYELVFMGEVGPNGGTSAATPLWAALLTRIYAAGEPADGPTFLTPLLYQNGPNGQPRGAEACVDITEGENPSRPHPGVGYKASPGYDAVSGWGVPDGQKLLASLT